MKQTVVDLRVARVLKAIQAEPTRRFRVGELAKLAGASRASFARLFRAATGTSPQRWLRAHRLQQAAQLLVSTHETLAHIATRVGYQSEFALSRAFKRHYGLAPARYREQASFSVRCAAQAVEASTEELLQRREELLGLSFRSTRAVEPVGAA